MSVVYILYGLFLSFACTMSCECVCVVTVSITKFDYYPGYAGTLKVAGDVNMFFDHTYVEVSM